MQPLDLKPKFEDILEVKTLFNSSGWTKFESKIREQLDTINYFIDEITRRQEVFTEADVPVMNELRAAKRVLIMLLQIKTEMLEDVDPDFEEKES